MDPINPQKVLNFWLRIFNMNKNGTTYVDGVEVDITTLTEMPDVLISIPNEYSSIMLIKTVDTSTTIRSYCIRCSHWIDIYEISNYDLIGKSPLFRGDPMCKYLSEKYGYNFSTNLDALYKLARIVDSLVDTPLSEDQLISRFESINLIKRAS